MRTQTERALQDADVALFLVDARAGLTPMDEHFAGWLRGQDTPVIVVANKCEGRVGEQGRLEAYALGLGDPLPVSAEHGEGMGELFDALRPIADAAAMREEVVAAAEAAAEAEHEEGEEKALQLAVVGRPNVGKSTLINRLVGEERLLTGPEAGITRDSIAVEWTHAGRDIRLIDTAGLRRKAKVTAKVETLSAAETLRAVRFAHVVVLMLDARDMLEKQDLTIARTVIDEGRALVLAVNKWDLIEDRRAAMNRLRDRLETSLPQVRGIPVVTLSALDGRGVDKLLPAVLGAYEAWNRRVPTAALNRWLEDMTARHPPPLAKGRRIRIRYATQAKTRPPTFILFVSRPGALPEAYLRYLGNGLRDTFDLWGVPLRFTMRRPRNPYASD
jgi:GTP-binding protein